MSLVEALKKEQGTKVYKCTFGFDSIKKGDVISEYQYNHLSETRKLFFENISATPEEIKKVKKERRVARFPMFSPTAVSRQCVGHELSHEWSYEYKSFVSTKLPKLLHHGAGSAAMALSSNGWYYQEGCCAGIQNALTGPEVIYYAPHVGPLSLKKKIEYIKELERLFPKTLSFLGVIDGPNVTNPLVAGAQPQRIALRGNTAGAAQPNPTTFVAANKYLVIRASIEGNNRYRLMYLQFIRPLYQKISVSSVWLDGWTPTGQVVSTFEYYQPRLYFKLKKLFPKMSIEQLMYLSFTIHGKPVSSTYFPYYVWYNKYRPKFKMDEASINSMASAGFVENFLNFKTIDEVNEFIKSGSLDVLKFPTIKCPNINNAPNVLYSKNKGVGVGDYYRRLYELNSDLLAAIVLRGTDASLKAAATLIAELADDKTLKKHL